MMTNPQRYLRCVAICASVVLAPAPGLAQSPGPSRVQGAASGNVDVRFKLPHAIGIAEREGRGKAISAVFTPFAAGGGALEVTVMRPDKTVVKYRVDANNGSVINVSEQTIESYVSSIDPAALAGLTFSMVQAVTATEGQADGGAVVGAEVQTEGDGLAYEVSVVKDGETKAFTVTPDGKVAAD
ncbi:PepSY domain-containing protein [Methylopila sp. 73B]|uniref:PepSY domain-containing protein n=1 Tax=Methylopila sp. 73B TaxID=1120792 RepID=UPI0003658618|nr:PepSY domain-containing protein [Methylopila sp. 73B]